MLDFLMISTRSTKRGNIEIYPKFIIKKSRDLMIRGGDFYAIWNAETKLWSTEEQDAIDLIDTELRKYAEENQDKFDGNVKVLYLWDSESGMIDRWHKFCQKQSRDSFHSLDEKLIFSNMETKKTDYASKKLPYPLEEGECPAFEKLMSTLYEENERRKIEWAIGAVVTGASKKIQKFLVLYGAQGSGKSTIIRIIEQLFEGYCAVFDAKSLGSSNNAFALEAFRSNPLVAIQHDGDLSRIEDNTRLNSLVSHEKMTVNEKFKATYSSRFNAFLFMGTNKPVKITDAKSGLIRRLIDVQPSGNKLSLKEYRKTTGQIKFELGAIAFHCQEVYLANPSAYDDYVPTTMLGASNEFYNFVEDSYWIFKKEDGVSAKAAWEMYKTYCDKANMSYPMNYMRFKEELRAYFKEFQDRGYKSDGTRPRSYYSGFKTDIFESAEPQDEETPYILDFNCTKSRLDEEWADCPAQYANKAGTPSKAWDNVETTLKDLNTKRIHYVMPPKQYIEIDFDIPDAEGNKSLELNIEAASKWPPTYAELSKSGKGIHLHYIYDGDITQLAPVYDDHIEVKTHVGKFSLRRKVSRCNDLPVRLISSGLPFKEKKKGSDNTLNIKKLKDEESLRKLVIRNLNKEIHSNTTQSVNFIKHILDEAYESDLDYDISDMRPAILSFCAGSTHQAEYCMKTLQEMKFASPNRIASSQTDISAYAKAPIVFFDVEVFPNLLLVSYKMTGDENPVIHMFNPKPTDIEDICQFRLIGFNCRKYDNHICYARMIGHNNEQIYRQSQAIVNSKKGEKSFAFFGNAYNLSYTDVFDFAATKQSLKKWEIELGIHHQELGLPWDEPVPKEKWDLVAEYCANDVIATEKLFKYLAGDWKARQILADLAGKTVNDTTNRLTTSIIFGNNRNTQSSLKWRDMGKAEGPTHILFDDPFTVFDEQNRPIFPGYTFEKGKSFYRDECPGEGGYVYASKKLIFHYNVACSDIASQHPTSIETENLFGEYTKNFSDLKQARIAIKHGDLEQAKTMLNGKLAKYLDDGETAASLSQALKIAINSVYGLTSAKFSNEFKDERNKDNIVAKRGALFMINLRHMVEERGYEVVHIKTDSIKIANATPDILQFVNDYGKAYGYTFEHESTYDRLCLVNDAVFVAKYAAVERCIELYGKEYVNQSKDTLKDNKKAGGKWTATGKEFQVPYIFKKLFSGEKIEFSDVCEVFSSKEALYLDMNEELEDVFELEAQLKKLESKKKKLNKDFENGKIEKDELESSLEAIDAQCKELETDISKGHKYVFIGKVGEFCPVVKGVGGGELFWKDKGGKYHAVANTIGYRWLESEVVTNLHMEDKIDIGYYDLKTQKAKDHISEYGDFEEFIHGESKPLINLDFINIPEDVDEEVPF